MACPSAINSLHLSEAAVHEQFRSRDITAVFGCEKHNGFRDLIGRTQPAERNGVTNRLQALLARFRGSQQVTKSRGVDGAWAHRVHANTAIL